MSSQIEEILENHIDNIEATLKEVFEGDDIQLKLKATQIILDLKSRTFDMEDQPLHQFISTK